MRRLIRRARICGRDALAILTICKRIVGTKIDETTITSVDPDDRPILIVVLGIDGRSREGGALRRAARSGGNRGDGELDRA